MLGDDSLLLKYLNPHLLVVATSHNVTATSSTGMRKSVRMITIRVIDSVSGNVLDARSHSNARPPVLIDTQENWVQYTYWNAKVAKIAHPHLSLLPLTKSPNGILLGGPPLPGTLAGDWQPGAVRWRHGPVRTEPHEGLQRHRQVQLL